MLSALQLAMPEHPTTPSGTVRQVIFMTDGQVQATSRSFSPSSTPASARAALHGRHRRRAEFAFHAQRGALRPRHVTYIGDVQQVQERMSELFGNSTRR